MKLIPLSQSINCKNKSLNLFAKVDDEDFDKIKDLNFYARKDKNTFH